MRFLLLILVVISTLFAINITCRAQNETINIRQLLSKATNETSSILFTMDYPFGNRTTGNYSQIIDSIANTTGASGQFSKVYSETMKNIASQLKEMRSDHELFVKKFEATFAAYFLKACFAESNNELPETSEWKCFFSNTDARPWQIVLLGVNAHINIDFWQALTDNFSEKEIRQNKKQLLACRYSVAKVYSPLFDTMIAESRYLNFINAFTKGFARTLGEKIMFKWRRRAINLAILFYHEPEKFKKRWKIIKKKKAKNDKLILRKNFLRSSYEKH